MNRKAIDAGVLYWVDFNKKLLDYPATVFRTSDSNMLIHLATLHNYYVHIIARILIKHELQCSADFNTAAKVHSNT